MPKIGSFKIMVKPALAMIIGAVAVGSLIRPIASRISFKKLPPYGYMNPSTWRFNTSAGAKAEIKGITQTGALAPIESAGHILWVDSDKGFNINVIKPGDTPDTIFLRNVLDYDPTRFPKSVLNVSFEATAPKSFPVLFMVRDGSASNSSSGLLWSKPVTIEGSWKPYTMEIPTENLTKSDNTTTVFSLHMGMQPGDVSFRNIHIR